jgi:hypothetical protein
MLNINNMIRIFYGTQRRLYLILVFRVLKIQPCEEKAEAGTRSWFIDDGGDCRCF